jgi:hypothetical protein
MSHKAVERAGPSGAEAGGAMAKAAGVAQTLSDTRPAWFPHRSQGRTAEGEAREEERVLGDGDGRRRRGDGAHVGGGGSGRRRRSRARVVNRVGEKRRTQV